MEEEQVDENLLAFDGKELLGDGNGRHGARVQQTRPPVAINRPRRVGGTLRPAAQGYPNVTFRIVREDRE